MATWKSLGDINLKQVLKGNDEAPDRLNRPKNAKRQESAQLNVNKSQIEEVKSPVVTQNKQEEVVLPYAINYGDEGETKEFKTSFFYKDGRIKETEQMYDVLKEVCAFLNNKGGIIYMGVNDDGNIKGIEADIDFLSKNKAFEYARKKKDFTFSGRDGYKRWIANAIRYKIDLVRRYSINILVDYDKNGVLTINVPTGVHDVAMLDNGKAYVRRNSECILMSEETIKTLRETRQKESIMPEHEKKAKELATIVRNAIRGKKKVCLLNYCSGNSKKVSNRVLEIFECDANNEFVYAYEEASGLVKQFKLCRAEAIEIMDELWEYENMHSHRERDIFNMSRSHESQSETITIEMNLRAKTLLEEEYPNAKREIHAISASQWVLDTTVMNLKGVGRFCIGLLDDIRIVRGEMLRGYIASYLMRQAHQYCL